MAIKYVEEMGIKDIFSGVEEFTNWLDDKENSKYFQEKIGVTDFEDFHCAVINENRWASEDSNCNTLIYVQLDDVTDESVGDLLNTLILGSDEKLVWIVPKVNGFTKVVAKWIEDKVDIDFILCVIKAYKINENDVSISIEENI